MRIVLFADTHLGFDYPLRPRVDRRRLGPDFFDNYHRVLGYAARTRPDLVVHGGDFFFRAGVPRKIVDMTYEPLFDLVRTGIPVVLVPGNHERSRLPQSLWLANPNIHVFDRPRTFLIESSGHRMAVSGFPFARAVGDRFRALVAETDWAWYPAEIKLLCMRQDVDGSRVGPSDYTFRTGRDVVSKSDVPKAFTAVLARHIHRRQVLTNVGRSQPPVIYPGSTERTSFAERHEPKGFFEIELRQDDAGEWGVGRQEFHELPARPMVDLEIDSSVPFGDLRGYLANRAADLNEHTVVRLNCRGRLAPGVAAQLTAPFLRSVFPYSMNVQVSIDIYSQAPAAQEHAY